jgi:hypothetical protein
MNAIILTLLVLGAVPGPAEFQAGVARKAITPTGSIWMSGYAARTRPSEGVMHDLWAKALALKDARGKRVVIVSTDLIGLPREVSDEVAARVKQKHGLQRAELLLNSSHTHSGPGVWPNLQVMFDVSPGDRQRLIDYRDRLVDDLVEVVGAALADLSPATFAAGHGSAGFAVNRRQPSGKGFKLGVNPAGPVDHDVPVLRIATPGGKLRAVLFGYACHNTTLGGDRYEINGDYAGFAQIELEKALPGATALFLMLCGGDQNPHPRGTPELAAQHGKTLAGEVERVLAGGLRPLCPTIRTGYEEVKLDLARRERAVFEQEAKGNDRFGKRCAEAVLAALDAGRQVWQVPVPVQVVGFGDNLAMLALGGEVVVDYSLRLKRECPQTDLIVAGYTNEVMCYIPSRRVLGEGGYEVVESMIYYGQAGPFAANVEETLIAACRRLLVKVGVK